MPLLEQEAVRMASALDDYEQVRVTDIGGTDESGYWLCVTDERLELRLRDRLALRLLGLPQLFRRRKAVAGETLQKRGGGVAVDRRALNVLLAALELDQGALAQHMGYRAGYVTNVLNGCTPPSDPFRDAFGRVLADLMPGESPSAERMYPAAPLRKLIEKHAAAAMARSQFYADRGITCHGWNKRQHSSEASSTGCCALGVHPSSVYPEFVDCEEAS